MKNGVEETIPSELKLINMSKIKVPHIFAESTPRQSKYAACMQHFLDTGAQDRVIVLTPSNKMVDGYIQYLVLKELGYTKCWAYKGDFKHPTVSLHRTPGLPKLRKEFNSLK